MKLLLLNTVTGLLPIYNSDFESKKKLALNEQYWVDIKKARNPEHHKKYWALMKVGLEFLPEEKKKHLEDVNKFKIKTTDDLHFYVKLKLGLIERRFVGKDGHIGYQPKSIAFDAMDQIEFTEFYKKAVDAIIELTAADKDLIESNLMNFM